MQYIISVDQSTSASKVFLVDGQGQIVRRFSKAHRQSYPFPGWAEHDAQEIWENVRAGIYAVLDGLDRSQVAAIAISNQRETTVLWDRASGAPLAPAVVWQDVRAQALCDALKESADAVRKKTGLALSPYYPAAKAAHVLRENPALREKMQQGALCIGTVDSFLLFRMTGGRVFRTDVTNAGRTLLMDLETLSWDDELCALFGISRQALAEITPSDGDFGTFEDAGIPITGVLGDSHAALFGQGCLEKGMTKATFGTGSSVMMNVGEAPVFSENGLSASVGFGFQGKTHYVLEGNVTCSGDTLVWLRDEAKMVSSIDEIEPLAASVQDSGGVFLVPAFSGLSAPYFDSAARAAILGMSRGTTNAHIVRAALESLAYQDADILRAMEKDTGVPASALRVDGGPTKNALLMQILSDLSGARVVCTKQSELSALGAAFLAGIKTGLYPDFAQIPAAQDTGVQYAPHIESDERNEKMQAWQGAVARCR